MATFLVSSNEQKQFYSMPWFSLALQGQNICVNHSGPSEGIFLIYYISEHSSTILGCQLDP